MTWDFRRVHWKDEANADEYIAIHAVYYDRNGMIWAISDRPETIILDVTEDGGAEELGRTLQRIAVAALKPVIEGADYHARHAADTRGADSE